jgi:hypothetical protein
MKGEIPSVIGLLALVGCTSDAAAVANTFEKVCKSQCECSSIASAWNDIKNCKKSCMGYATELEALIDDALLSENPTNLVPPCDDLRKILNDTESCASEHHCPDECLSEQYMLLGECWPLVFYYYYYGNASAESVSGADLMLQLISPIPGPIPAEQLHSGTHE